MDLSRCIVAALVPFLTLAGCTPTPTAIPTTPAPTASAPATATTTPTTPTTPTPMPTTTTLVYFLVDAPGGFRLAREPHDVPAATPALGAVEAMLDTPDDPDYSSTWNPATTVLGIAVRGDVVTVDLSAEARTANVGSGAAAAMMSQLIWTVTEALGDDKGVMLNIAGAPAGELWGVLSWDEPEKRGEAMDSLLMVGIDTPREGATVTSPVGVVGQAAAYEANLPWRVLSPGGAVVKQGNATTAEGQVMAPYSFTVDLPAGTYRLEVTEDDPSGGEGGELDVDSRTFTVG